MAQYTGSILSSINAVSLFPESAPPFGGMGSNANAPPIGLGKGVGFAAGVDGSAIYLFRVNLALSGTTGLKVDVVLADDPSDTNAVISKNAYIGATIGVIASTTTFDEDATTGALHGSTEVLSAITMPAKAGVLKTATISIPNASLNSLAAGGWACLRVRRKGTNALDTDPGRVVLLATDVYDY